MTASRQDCGHQPSSQLWLGILSNSTSTLAGRLLERPAAISSRFAAFVAVILLLILMLILVLVLHLASPLILKCSSLHLSKQFQTKAVSVPS